MQDQDLGFNKNQMLVINYYGDSVVQANTEYIRQELSAIPNVKEVSFSSNAPGTSPDNWYLRIANPKGDMQGANLNTYVIDFDYFHIYSIKLAAGRDFSHDFSTDSTKAMVLNEAAARSLGYTDPAKAVGRRFSEWGVDGTIVPCRNRFNRWPLKC